MRVPIPGETSGNFLADVARTGESSQAKRIFCGRTISQIDNGDI
jgi:hypothetical protein